MTQLPKEHKVSPRWHNVTHGFHALMTSSGETLATIDIDGTRCLVKTRNRAGGWNYASAGTVRSAKAKAKRMIREEQV